MGEGRAHIMGDKIYRAAVFPKQGFRSVLYRSWTGRGPIGAFIGLNPGKADGQRDDMTATKYVGFAKRWGWRGYWAFNLFEFVATSPLVLAARAAQQLPLNTERDCAIHEYQGNLDMICLAWGNPPPRGYLREAWVEQTEKVVGMLARWQRESSRDVMLVVAGATKSGNPVHLSRFPYVAKPRPVAPLDVITLQGTS
jgi:hypothetical protein